MARTVTQSVAGTTPALAPTNLTSTITYATVTAGRALAVAAHYVGTSVRTFVVSDDIVGTTGWVRHARYSGAGGPEIWVHPSHPGGAVVVTVTHNNNNGDFRCAGAEIDGFGGTVTLVDSDIFLDPATTLTHYCADPGLTSVANVFALAAGGAMGSSMTDSSVPTGWTDITSGIWLMFGGKDFPTGLTADRAEWASTGTVRVSRGVMVLLSGAAPANPAPDPDSVSPLSGAPGGGTAVTITGTGFVTGATVTFGGQPATSVVVVSGTSITCVTPAHVAGAVDIVVTNPDTQLGTLAAGFTYVDLTPVILQNPTTINISTAGTTLTLTGTTAGSTIVVRLSQTSAALGREWTVSDNVNGAYTQRLRHNPERAVWVFDFRNNVGGTLILSFVKTAGGSATTYAKVQEIGNLSTTLSPVTGTKTDDPATTVHPCSAGLNSDGRKAFLVAVSVMSSDLGTVTPGAGYTTETVDQTLFQHRVATVPVTTETAEWSSNLSRKAASAHVAYLSDDGVDPTPPESEDSSTWW